MPKNPWIEDEETKKRANLKYIDLHDKVKAGTATAQDRKRMMEIAEHLVMYEIIEDERDRRREKLMDHLSRRKRERYRNGPLPKHSRPGPRLVPAKSRNRK